MLEHLFLLSTVTFGAASSKTQQDQPLTAPIVHWKSYISFRMEDTDEKATHIVIMPRETHINKFYGDGDATLTDRFYEEVKAAWASRRMTSAERLRVLMNSIGEMVRAEVKCQDKELQTDPDRVLDLIVGTFGERRSGSQLLSVFVSLKQRQAESVREYSHRINSAFDAVKAKTPNVDPSLLRDHFIEGLAAPLLKRDLKEEVFKDPKLTFLRIRDIAIRRADYEDEASCMVDKISVPVKNVATPEGTSTLEMMMAQMLAHLNKVDQRLALLETKSGADSRGGNATANTSGKRQRKEWKSPQWTADGQPICFQCSQPGHMARHCPGNDRPL